MDIGDFLAYARQHALDTPDEIDAFFNDLPTFVRWGGKLPRDVDAWRACFAGWQQAQPFREHLAQQRKVRES